MPHTCQSTHSPLHPTPNTPPYPPSNYKQSHAAQVHRPTNCSSSPNCHHPPTRLTHPFRLPPLPTNPPPTLLQPSYQPSSNPSLPPPPPPPHPRRSISNILKGTRASDSGEDSKMRSDVRRECARWRVCLPGRPNRSCTSMFEFVIMCRRVLPFSLAFRVHANKIISLRVHCCGGYFVDWVPRTPFINAPPLTPHNY